MMTSAERKEIKEKAQALSVELIKFCGTKHPQTIQGALIATLAVKNVFSVMMETVIEKQIIDPELFGLIEIKADCGNPNCDNCNPGDGSEQMEFDA